MARSTISNFETLESRTMMSAAPVLHVEATAHHAPVVKAPMRHVTAPTKTVNPVTTEKSISYKSFASDPLFASSGPTMADINQGYLGDCYLLSTLSSVVKTDAARIKKDIVADGNGIFTVTFGTNTKINVNADLPVWPDGRVAYAGLGLQNSLWVALMEKAYVIYSNAKTPAYHQIEGGWMTSAFSALNLKSTNVTGPGSGSDLLTTLQSDLKAGDFVTFGTKTTLPTGSPLVTSHAYEVDAVNVDTAGKPVSVTLRNPWGDSVADDGMITVTATQAFAGFAGVVIAHA